MTPARYLNPRTGAEWSVDEPLWKAPDDDGYVNLKPAPGFDPGEIEQGVPSLWRYASSLRIQAPLLTLGEGWTPLLEGKWNDAPIHLKCDHMMPSGSFKDRGAFVKLKSVSQEGGKGVIAISAGNHAQGVAYHAQRLGIPATIVMPKGTPFTKIVRTRDFGARVVLEGESVSDGKPFADEIAAAKISSLFIHTTTPISSPAKAQSVWKFSKIFRTWTPSSSLSAAAVSSPELRWRRKN